MFRATPHIQLADSELVERFVHAGGPGGQHVNKTATAVQLRFCVADSPSLPPDVKARLLRMAAGRINQDGELVIEARRYRSQQRNRDDARKRLANWIASAARPPKHRKATRPSRAAKARRVNHKKKRGHTKRLRGIPAPDD